MSNAFDPTMEESTKVKSLKPGLRKPGSSGSQLFHMPLTKMGSANGLTEP